MITGIALILIAVFVAMPKAVMITLCVFGSWKIFHSVVRGTVKFILKYKEETEQ